MRPGWNRCQAARSCPWGGTDSPRTGLLQFILSGEQGAPAMVKLTHPRVWRAIDRTAKEHGLSTSALAKAANLDSTSFNKSKRVSPTGKPRWPSVETLAKVLNSVGDSIEDFVKRL